MPIVGYLPDGGRNEQGLPIGLGETARDTAGIVRGSRAAARQIDIWRPANNHSPWSVILADP